MTDDLHTSFEHYYPPAAAEPDSPEVTAYLSRIAWGEDYPEELLVVSDEEQRVLDQHDQGLTFVDMAQQEGFSNQDTYMARYHVGLAKQELAVSRGVNIHDLGADAKRFLTLNDLFGSGWPEESPLPMNRALDTMLEYAGFMDEAFGQKWRNESRLRLFSCDNIQAKIAAYDKHLEPDWRDYPGLLFASIKTVLSSARALPYVGVTPANTAPSTYYTLLHTKLSTKQKKVVYIRRALLGHTQIRNSSQKRSTATLGTRKARQTEADRQAEIVELDELRRFIVSMNAKCLTQSTQVITTEAYNRGLIKPRTEPKA